MGPGSLEWRRAVLTGSDMLSATNRTVWIAHPLRCDCTNWAHDERSTRISGSAFSFAPGQSASVWHIAGVQLRQRRSGFIPPFEAVTICGTQPSEADMAPGAVVALRRKQLAGWDRLKTVLAMAGFRSGRGTGSGKRMPEW